MEDIVDLGDNTDSHSAQLPNDADCDFEHNFLDTPAAQPSLLRSAGESVDQLRAEDLLASRCLGKQHPSLLFRTNCEGQIGLKRKCWSS